MDYSVIIIQPEITPVVKGDVDSTATALSGSGLVKFSGPNDEVIYVNSDKVISVLEFSEAIVNDAVEPA